MATKQEHIQNILTQTTDRVNKLCKDNLTGTITLKIKNGFITYNYIEPPKVNFGQYSWNDEQIDLIKINKSMNNSFSILERSI